MRVGETLGRALGAEVEVTARGDSCRVALAFDSFDAALAAAERLGAALDPAGETLEPA